MVEPELAFADLNDIMDLAERLVMYWNLSAYNDNCIRHCVRTTLEDLGDDVSILNEKADNQLLPLLHSIADLSQFYSNFIAHQV